MTATQKTLSTWYNVTTVTNNTQEKPNIDLKTASTKHRRTIDKQTNSSKPTTVSEHFLCNNHNATDMQLIPLELVKSNRDSVRKAREAYLIERGQTLEPHDLKKKDETFY